MRLLYFSDNNSDHNRRFLTKLAASKHEVFYLTLAGDPPSDFLPQGIRLVPSPATFSRHSRPESLTAFVPALKRITAAIKPDIVQAGAIQNCAYLSALAGMRPMLAMSWGSDLLVDADRDDEWRAATQLALSGADGLFCDCDTVRQKALQLSPKGFRHIVQFPWGIEPGVFSPDGQEVELPWSPTDFVLISTRALEISYRADVLIETFRVVQAREPRVRLLLLSSGSYEANIRKIAEQGGLSDKILITGNVKRNDLPSYFRAADAYISCAPSDGSSISLLEAMATGLPAIVADNPSNREWLTEGVNGWFATIGSPQSNVDKVLEVAALDAKAREKTSRISIETVRTRANWDENFPLLLAAYDALRIK